MFVINSVFMAASGEILMNCTWDDGVETIEYLPNWLLNVGVC